MICSAMELGLGDDHDGIIVLEEWLGDNPEVVAGLEPGQDAIELLGLADEVVEVNVTPTAATASRCAASRASTPSPPAVVADPADVETPVPSDGGYAAQLTDSAPVNGNQGCDRYIARIVRGVDVNAATPPWMRSGSPRWACARSAWPSTSPLRDDAARPAAARVRPRHPLRVRRCPAGEGRSG